MTRKYPLCGYILGVLMHTTAWEWLLGDDETLTYGFRIERTYLGFASAEKLGLGIWNSDRVVLKLNIHTSTSPSADVVWKGIWNSDNVILKLTIYTLAASWREQSDCASVTLTLCRGGWIYTDIRTSPDKVLGKIIGEHSHGLSNSYWHKHLSDKVFKSAQS